MTSVDSIVWFKGFKVMFILWEMHKQFYNIKFTWYTNITGLFVNHPTIKMEEKRLCLNQTSVKLGRNVVS